ncbi:hypothetical protein AKJ57_01860 [candidate division MSBL1 archaeon SCGC-AAA259A05]|uniref:Rhodanese domain-containing protein n=1 Tax=candidate division MSBL1 archaeon SCGC-AAA259A05 TaxID=1698259 RepID=A0A133UAS2_9EURY|nr:hypothetical protein AKJ57_01860 [candidate division MSBL1 archaeon SCGC-AAA259A05]
MKVTRRGIAISSIAAASLVVLVVVSLLGLPSGGRSSALYENIRPVEAKELIVSEDPVVLDVRTPDEFEEGHIPGAILVPVDELRGSTLLEFPEDEEVLCYCRSGHRSSWAAKYLGRQGYVQAYNLSGGILAWKNRGYKVVEALENKPECPCVVLE